MNRQIPNGPQGANAAATKARRTDRKAGASLYEQGRAAERDSTVPAAVLPEQFYGTPTQEHARGEFALMRSVLADAIHCFQKQFGAPRFRDYRIAKEAEEWFFSDDDRWPFSFVNISAALGIDADYVRRGLRRLLEERPVTVPPRARRDRSMARQRLRVAA